MIQLITPKVKQLQSVKLMEYNKIFEKYRVTGDNWYSVSLSHYLKENTEGGNHIITQYQENNNYSVNYNIFFQNNITAKEQNISRIVGNSINSQLERFLSKNMKLSEVKKNSINDDKRKEKDVSNTQSGHLYLERLLKPSGFMRKGQSDAEGIYKFSTVRKSNEAMAVQSMLRGSTVRKAYGKTKKSGYHDGLAVISSNQAFQFYKKIDMSQSLYFALGLLFKLSDFKKKEQSELGYIYGFRAVKKGYQDKAVQSVHSIPNIKSILHMLHQNAFQEIYDRLRERYSYNVSSVLYGNTAIGFYQKKSVSQGLYSYLENLLTLSIKREQSNKESDYKFSTARRNNPDTTVQSILRMLRQNSFRKANGKAEESSYRDILAEVYNNQVFQFNQKGSIGQSPHSYLKNLLKIFGFSRKEQSGLEDIYKLNTVKKSNQNMTVQSKSIRGMENMQSMPNIKSIFGQNTFGEVYDRLREKYSYHVLSALYGNFAIGFYQKRSVSKNLYSHLENLLKFSKKEEKPDVKGVYNLNSIRKNYQDKAEQSIQSIGSRRIILRQNAFREVYDRLREEYGYDVLSATYGDTAIGFYQKNDIRQGLHFYLENLLTFSKRREQSDVENNYKLSTARKNNQDMAVQIYDNQVFRFYQKSSISQSLHLALKSLLELSDFKRKRQLDAESVYNLNDVRESHEDKAKKTMLRQNTFREMYDRLREKYGYDVLSATYGNTAISVYQKSSINRSLSSSLENLLRLSSVKRKEQTGLENVYQLSIVRKNNQDVTVQNVFGEVYDRLRKKYSYNALSVLYGNTAISFYQKKAVSQSLYSYFEDLLKLSNFKKKEQVDLENFSGLSTVRKYNQDMTLQGMRSIFRKLHNKLKEKYEYNVLPELYGNTAINFYQKSSINQSLNSSLENMLKRSGVKRKEQTSLENVYQLSAVRKNNQDMTVQDIFGKLYDRLRKKYSYNALSALYGNTAIGFYQKKAVSQSLYSYFENLLKLSSFKKKERADLENVYQLSTVRKNNQDMTVQDVFGKLYDRLRKKYSYNALSALYGNTAIGFYQKKAVSQSLYSYFENLLKLSSFKKKERADLKNVYQLSTVRKNNQDMTVQDVFGKLYDRLRKKYSYNALSALYGNTAIGFYQKKAVSQSLYSYFENLLKLSSFKKKERADLENVYQLSAVRKNNQDMTVQDIFGKLYDRLRKKYSYNALSALYGNTAIGFYQKKAVSQSLYSYFENLLKHSSFKKKERADLENVYQLSTVRKNNQDMIVQSIRSIFRQSTFNKVYARAAESDCSDATSEIYNNQAIRFYKKNSINQSLHSYLEKLLKHSSVKRKKQTDLENVTRLSTARKNNQGITVQNMQSIFRELYDRLKEKYGYNVLSALRETTALNFYQKKAASQSLHSYTENLLKRSGVKRKEQRNLENVYQLSTTRKNNQDMAVQNMQGIQDILEQNVFRERYDKLKEKYDCNMLSVLNETTALNFYQKKAVRQSLHSHIENLLKHSGYQRKEQTSLDDVYQFSTARKNNEDIAVKNVKSIQDIQSKQDLLEQSVFRELYDRLKKKYGYNMLSALHETNALSYIQKKAVSKELYSYLGRLLKPSSFQRKGQLDLENVYHFNAVRWNQQDKREQNMFRLLSRGVSENLYQNSPAMLYQKGFLNHILGLFKKKKDDTLYEKAGSYIVNKRKNIHDRKDEGSTKSAVYQHRNMLGYQPRFDMGAEDKKRNLILSRESFTLHKAMIKRIKEEKDIAEETFDNSTLFHKKIQTQNQKASSSDSVLKETIALLDELSGQDTGHISENRKNMGTMQEAIQQKTSESAAERELILMRDEVPKIVDMVYEKLEKRLKTERRRRGMI